MYRRDCVNLGKQVQLIRPDGSRQAVTAVVFQTFENSIPRLEARGEAGGGRAITYDNAAAYAAELMRRTR